MSYSWEWSVVGAYFPALLRGAWLTIELTAASILFGTLLGIVAGVMRASSVRVLRWSVAIYIEIFLALPVLVLLIWVYYCVPILFPGVTLSNIATAILVLALSLGAFVAEIVRAGITGIPRSQVEVAWSMGISGLATLQHIILPQASRLMIPPLMGQYITCWKLSSLASVIAVYELVHSAQNVISVTYRPLELYTAVAVFYLAMILPVNLILKRFELVPSTAQRPG